MDKSPKKKTAQKKTEQFGICICLNNEIGGLLKQVEKTNKNKKKSK